MNKIYKELIEKEVLTLMIKNSNINYNAVILLSIFFLINIYLIIYQSEA